MSLVGERKLTKAISTAKVDGSCEAIPYRRGNILGVLEVEAYKDVLGISLSAYNKNNPSVVEYSFTDITALSKYNALREIQKILPKLFRLCEIGLYVKEGIWENPLPNDTTLEDIAEFFDVSSEELQNALREDIKYGKVKLCLKGKYYGEKEIELLQSKRTRFITNILNIR